MQTPTTTELPAVEQAAPEPFVLVSDDSGHEYAVPRSKRDSFYLWVDSDEAEEGGDPPAWTTRVEGDFQFYLDPPTPSVALAVNQVVNLCHGASSIAGWWKDDVDTPYLVPAKLMLVVSEVAEAMEGHRKDLMDDHLPHRKMVEVELADAVIRIADLAGAMELDLGGALMEKVIYNKQRADHKLENRAKKGGKSY